MLSTMFTYLHFSLYVSLRVNCHNLKQNEAHSTCISFKFCTGALGFVVFKFACLNFVGFWQNCLQISKKYLGWSCEDSKRVWVIFILTWQAFQPLFTDQQGVLGEKPQWQQRVSVIVMLFIFQWQPLWLLCADQQVFEEKPKDSDKKCLSNVYFDLANFTTTVYRSARNTLAEA